MTMDIKALKSAKARRLDARDLGTSTQVSAQADAADFKVCEEAVATFTHARADAVAVAKPDAVIEADAKLQRARVALEIAASRVESSARAHAEAATALAQADEVVRQAAHQIRCAERQELAAEFVAAIDRAEALGRKLEFFAGPIAARPPEILEALARVPRGDDLHRSVAELRGYGATTRAWDERLKQLCADDEPSPEAAAA
jgi:hypothetical protein